MPHKRENYLEWQEYFMSIAFLSAQRSKDPRTQVGACIVSSENKIVGIGYNGMPVGCDDDKMPWNRAADKSTENWLNSKTPYVCHAELNAVLNKNLADVSGCAIYVALFPCNMCAQIIVQSGIKEVIFYSDKYRDHANMIASRRLLDMAGVKYRQFKPRQKKVVIDFGVIEDVQNLEPTLKTDSMGDSVSSTSSNNGDVLNNNNINDAKMANNNNKGVENRASLTNHAEIQNLPADMQREQVGQGHVESSHSVALFEPWTISLLSLFLVVIVLFFNFLAYFYPDAIALLLEGIQRMKPLSFFVMR